MSQAAGSVAARMTQKLSAAFAPETLEVLDESHHHADHFVHEGGAGHQGETHFRVRIVSEAFASKTRVARHRAINELLADEIAGGVHALAIEARAPGEPARR